MRGPIAFALAALIAGVAGADESRGPEPCAFPMEEVPELLELQLQAMEERRAILGLADIGFVPSALRERIVEFVETVPDRARPGAHALVAYLVSGENVCVLYARPVHGSTRIDMIQLPRSASELSRVVDETMASFIASGPAVPRVPERRQPHDGSQRGARALPNGEVTRGSDPRRLLGSLAEALFPFGHFDGIESGAVSLSIVPALNIGRVPFAALDLDGDGSPLAEKVTINLEPSLKDVAELSVYAWRWEHEIPLVVGDPDATGDPDWRLPRLPGADSEARAVAAMLGAEPIIGPSATRSRFVEGARQASYIHVAAHGIASFDDPIDASFIALSDGRLTAREIQHLRLEARPVVVLSACQTALGGPLQAGIIGISRAFLLAGGVNVVSSLWNVDDAATAEIMRDFVSRLPQVPPAEALRQAQLQARSRWPDPRIWSAFVVFGNRIVVP